MNTPPSFAASFNRTATFNRNGESHEQTLLRRSSTRVAAEFRYAQFWTERAICMSNSGTFFHRRIMFMISCLTASFSLGPGLWGVVYINTKQLTPDQMISFLPSYSSYINSASLPVNGVPPPSTLPPTPVGFVMLCLLTTFQCRNADEFKAKNSLKGVRSFPRMVPSS